MTNEEVAAILVVLQERYDVEEQHGGTPDYREALRRAEYAVSEVERLRAENNTLRLQLHEWSKRELELEDARAQSAELDWFRRRELLVRLHMQQSGAVSLASLRHYEDTTPKPGAGA